MMLDVVERVNFYGKDEEAAYIMGPSFVSVYEYILDIRTLADHPFRKKDASIYDICKYKRLVKLAKVLKVKSK